MRSSAISSRVRGTATRRSGPSCGPRARPASGVRRRRTTFTARRRDASARGEDGRQSAYGAPGRSPWRQRLRPHRRSLDRHAARAPHQIKFEIDVFGCAQGIGDGAHSEQAVAQSALQRSKRLPFEAIERISGRVALRDRGAGELLATIVVVALCNGELEITLVLDEELDECVHEGPGALVY